MSRAPRPKSAMRIYQTWTVKLLKRPWSSRLAERLPGVILAYDMGSGKTAATLTAMRELLDEFVIRKVLVVAPLLVAQTTWPDEIDDWEHLRGTTYSVIRAEDYDPEIVAAGAAAYATALEQRTAEFETLRQENLALGMKPGKARDLARKELGAAPSAYADSVRDAAVAEAKEAMKRHLASEDAELHIINREALPWLWDFFGAGARWPYDVIVIDEASMLKSGKHRSLGSATKKKGPRPLSRFGILAKARKHVDAVIELTGTPAPNGLHNLWGLAYVIDLGERLGATKTAFENRWFSQGRYDYKPKPFPHSSGEITDKLRDIMFSLNPADYAELPPMVMSPRKVRLPPAAMEEYKRFKRTLVSDVYDVEAVSQGVLHNKLLQFANGSMYQESGDDVWVHDFKLDALSELVEELEDEPLLVAYGFKFDLARIRKRFPKAVVLNEVEPRAAVRDWSDGKIKMLLAHPASAGHGLNLQYGGHHGVWYGLTPDLELYQQFNKRLLRPGQAKPVFMHQIIAEGTLDETLLPLLDDKKAVQDKVLKAVQVHIGGD